MTHEVRDAGSSTPIHYTREEADARLPELRAQLERIRRARETIISSTERITTKAPVNGGGPETEEHRQALAALREELEIIGREGIVLRDPETGLVDFPSEREGVSVYLCWRLGEDAVRFWHPLDSGFGGRRPLE